MILERSWHLPGGRQRERWGEVMARYVILDRDGTLNVERHYLSEPDQVEELPGVLAGLVRMQSLGLGLAIVTNQSAIGRGYFDLVRLEQIHARLLELLSNGGVRIDAIYFCPHLPEDGCRCRKPEPALVEQAASHLGFEPATSFVIGDKHCDLQLGRRVGAYTVLVKTGYGAETAATAAAVADAIVEDWKKRRK